MSTSSHTLDPFQGYDIAIEALDGTPLGFWQGIDVNYETKTGTLIGGIDADRVAFLQTDPQPFPEKFRIRFHDAEGDVALIVYTDGLLYPRGMSASAGRDATQAAFQFKFQLITLDQDLQDARKLRQAVKTP